MLLSLALLLSCAVNAQDAYAPHFGNKIPAAYNIAFTQVKHLDVVPSIPASAYYEDEGQVSDSAYYASILEEEADTTDVEPGDTLNMKLARNAVAADTLVASYFRGIYAADGNYTARKSGKRMILLTTLVGTPALSIIPAVLCTATAPSVRHLNIDKAHLSNPAYVKGYRYEAKYIKQKAVWGNYITGTVIWVGLAHFILL